MRDFVDAEKSADALLALETEAAENSADALALETEAAENSADAFLALETEVAEVAEVAKVAEVAEVAEAVTGAVTEAEGVINFPKFIIPNKVIVEPPMQTQKK